MASHDNGPGDAAQRKGDPVVTARPPGRRGGKVSDSDIPTQMYDPEGLVSSSGTLDLESSPHSAVRDTAKVEEEPAEESTCILDEDMLDQLDAGRVSLESGELTKSGTKSRGGSNDDADPSPKSASASQHDAAFLGRNFGGFRVVRSIASGGMASIYLGRKEAVGGFTQHAAIKVVHRHYADERDFIDMFLDEARIAARIQHPNVCRVLDFGKAERTYFLALEYVHGETWGKLMTALMRSSQGLDELPRCAAFVVSQACEGLHAAHTALDENGEPLHIVHRDISPDNLLVGYDGAVRVLDFGVAHAEARLTNTRAGVVKGRLAYMAPEQARGESVDARADVWSLGVLLREALERKRLFRRESEAQTIMAVTHDPLPEWKPGVSPALREIADKALNRDPEQRYANAREMGRALTRYLRGLDEPFGMAEVSTRMDEVFRDLKTEKRAWMKQPVPAPMKTGRLAKPSVPELEEGGQTVASKARVPSLGEAHNRAPQETLKLPAVRLDQLPGQRPSQPRVDRTTWLALIVACLAAALVAALWVNRYMGAPQQPPPAVQVIGPQQPQAAPAPTTTTTLTVEPQQPAPETP